MWRTGAEPEGPRTYSCHGLRKYHDPGGKLHTQFWHLYFFKKFLFLYPKLAARISKTTLARALSIPPLLGHWKAWARDLSAIRKQYRNLGLECPAFPRVFQGASSPKHLAQSRRAFKDNLLVWTKQLPKANINQQIHSWGSPKLSPSTSSSPSSFWATMMSWGGRCVWCRAPLQESVAYVWKESFRQSLEIGVRPKQILWCAHWAASTGNGPSDLRCFCLGFGLSARSVCHARLGPSWMPEHSRGGLDVRAIQGRKPPTEAEEGKGREQVCLLRTGSHWPLGWFVEQQPYLQLVSMQNLRPVQTYWIGTCILIRS